MPKDKGQICWLGIGIDVEGIVGLYGQFRGATHVNRCCGRTNNTICHKGDCTRGKNLRGSIARCVEDVMSAITHPQCEISCTEADRRGGGGTGEINVGVTAGSSKGKVEVTAVDVYVVNI